MKILTCFSQMTIFGIIGILTVISPKPSEIFYSKYQDFLYVLYSIKDRRLQAEISGRRGELTVQSSWFTVHDSQCTVHGSRFAVHGLWFTVHDSQLTVHDSKRERERGGGGREGKRE